MPNSFFGHFRKSLHRAVPAHFHDPLGLFLRLMRARDPAAIFTLWTSGLTMLALPLDVVLQAREKRVYQKANRPRYPLIIVTGPPRSGTSLVYQALINHLPVCYFNNVTAVFPRSPIVASLLFRGLTKKRKAVYESYYGKSDGFSGPNDGLHIWDRWMGQDRTRIPGFLTEGQKDEMARFFGAFQEAFQMPLVNKYNNLNTFAHLVAEAVEGSRFICMARDPLYLAQSLLKARREIHGDLRVPYGIHDQSRTGEGDVAEDMVEDVCRQVMFHHEKTREEQERIGAERFWIVPYEEFCEQPDALVVRVAMEILGIKIDREKLGAELKPFKPANSVKLESALFERIKEVFQRMEAQHNPGQSAFDH